MEITLGGFTVKPPNADDLRIAMLLWGDAGCGKTTLAATAPGKKLWILFDPDGALSLIGRDDIVVLDLSSERHSIVAKMKDDDPLGITKMLKDNPDIETVVFDSATAFASLALDHGVANIKRQYPNTVVSVEDPAQKGFGHRNTNVMRALTAMMRVTKGLGLHYIIITHEGAPVTDEKGNVLHITMQLGGQIPNLIGLQLSEIWWMSRNDKGKRSIAINPCRMRKPMKSRMFDGTGAVEFEWKFNPNTWSGDGIETWFNEWKEKGGRKVSIPT